MVPVLCCFSKCVLLYPSGTPNPDTMYTILRYTIRLYGKNRIVEAQNRIFGQGYVCATRIESNDQHAGKSCRCVHAGVHSAVVWVGEFSSLQTTNAFMDMHQCHGLRI
jgi:hypothetical protein